MRIQPAGNAGQHRGDDKDDHFHPGGIDAHRLGHHAAAAQCADGAAGPRLQQVLHGDRRQQQHQPDQRIHAAAAIQLQAEYFHRGDAVQAVILAQELQVAEQEKQRQAPGYRAQRQIMAGQPHRDHAYRVGGQHRQRQPDQQAQPRRQAIAGGQVSGGIGTQADKGSLAERSQAADAGQQYQAQRNDRIQAYVVGQGDPEFGSGQQRQQDNGRHECQVNAVEPLLHHSSSSSLCLLLSERHSKTGIISVNTITSL